MTTKLICYFVDFIKALEIYPSALLWKENKKKDQNRILQNLQFITCLPQKIPRKQIEQ
jgi:hypothetical protein